MLKPITYIKRVGYYIPFTLYLVVFGALLIFGYQWLNKISHIPDSAYTAIFSLLLSIALWFSLTIICLGFVSVLVSYIYIKWKQSKNDIRIQLQTIATKDSGLSNQLIKIHISPILLPIMGFLRVRIIYDNGRVSEKMSLASQFYKLFQLSYDGEFNWLLPEIREYQIEKVIIYIEDFFQFFSFATSINTSNRFFIRPTNQNLKTLKIAPRKTEETTIRIDELKRVEGELINYKNFETNDDVRRIVWKIYAKNKELIVRIPETLDPYASHIYLYTSFYSQFNVAGNEVIEAPFLNYYKTVCWSIYKQLVKTGYDVKYLSDQAIPSNTMPTPDEQAQYAIAVSNWQSTIPLKDFIKPQVASVLIISSLNELEQVKEFVDNFGLDISIIYVPLTECLEQQVFKDWIKWLFVENETNQLSSYKAKWNLSPIRFKVIENEKELSKALKNASKSSII